MVAEKSRTEYSARNTTVAITGRIIAILLGFVSRVVFTHTLSEDYVGINGLFTDILNVLALSELGIGTAINYALYKPIAEKDIEKQKSLMLLYKRFYHIVAGLVLTAGALVIPFLDVLIKDQPDVEHLTLIYIMYLANSAVSYLMIYKKTLIEAHQLSYISVLYNTVFLVIQNTLQIIVLLTTGNYMLYLSLLIGCTLLCNLGISGKADRMYPYLKDKEVKPLSGEEKKSIFQNMRAMMMHKVGNVMVNNTDNLLLSALVGTLSVGKYSNYFLIIGSVRQVLNQMFQGITASVGNMGVGESKERIRRIFEASFFIGQWVYGLAAICLYQVLDTFVGMSFGEQYVFPKSVTLVLCLNFYLTGMRQATLVFRDSMGLFWYDRYKSLAEAMVNLVVSLILGRYLGTVGVFLGTLVSTVTTSLWVEPYMLYKHRLKVSSVSYFLKYFLYASVTFLLWWGEDLLCRRVVGNPLVVCVLRFLLCFAITNAVYLVLYLRTREFRLLYRKAVMLLQKWYANRKGCKAWEKSSSGSASEGFAPEEKKLLALLKESLTGCRQGEAPALGEETSPDWFLLADMAKRHNVLALLYEPLAGERAEDAVPGAVRETVRNAAVKAAKQSYRLLFLSKFLTDRLKEAQIPVVLLKGAATAGFYPVPEYRKSGDVDLLLLAPERLEQCCDILKASGCRVKERQPSLHHVVFCSPEGIEVELHTMLAEPFDNQKMNRYLEEKIPECGKQICRAQRMGVTLPVLQDGYHAYELLLHMLQHFLRSGFGLKLLCDWVVFWNRDVDGQQRELYLSMVEESGLRGFSDMVTRTCFRYLGLSKDAMDLLVAEEICEEEEFMREILEAEEFGKSGKERMVALRSSSIQDYVRGFHYQMHLNFPRAGKCFLWWPVLWVITLFRFLDNNRKIRKVSAWEVFRKAGQRGRLIKQLRLWKKQ